MKFRFTKFKIRDKKTTFKLCLKWFIYIVLLLFFYMIQCSLPFIKWQPLLLIPLAIAVSIHEGECAGPVFGAVCGLMIDLASGSLFGFTSLWLMPCCLFAKLLTVNLIHKNLINYLWMTVSAFVVVQGMEIFFKYVIWREKYLSIVFINYILPSAVTAILLSPLIYLLIRNIGEKLNYERTEKELVTAFEDNNEKLRTRH